MLTAPDNLTAVLTAKLQEWQRERDELRGQLRAHQTHQEATATNVDGMTAA